MWTGLDLIIVDRNLLTTMIEKFPGRSGRTGYPAAAIGEDAGTVEDVYEPYLLKNGFYREHQEEGWSQILRIPILDLTRMKNRKERDDAEDKTICESRESGAGV